MAKNSLQKLLDYYVEEKMKQAKSDYYSVVYSINKELYREAWKMFDSFIDDFYSYETTSYIRHGQSRPGTKAGTNLYRANNIKMGGGYYNPKIYIDIDANDMDGGYEYDPPENVLNYVMKGRRFPYFNDASYWTGEYDGKYFSYSGQMENAFDTFCSYFDDIAKEAFYPRWKKLGWCD